MNADEIRRHWEAQAAMHSAAQDASWSDIHAMELEVDAIGSRLPERGRVLDIGCANGWSTLQFAARTRADFRGLDYVPAMVGAARANLERMEGALRGSVEFAVGDLL